MPLRDVCLPLDQAVRYWADPSPLHALDEMKQYSMPPVIYVLGGPESDHYLDMHTEWLRRYEVMQKNLVVRLRSEELVGSGFLTPITLSTRRKQIPPELWEILQLDFEASEVKAIGLDLIRAEVEEASDSDAAPGRPYADEFTHSAEYCRVCMRGLTFTLEGGLPQIVRMLDEASWTADPWLHGKRILEKLGYDTMFFGDVFKRHTDPSWRELIEGNRRGYYRLNRTQPPS